MRKLMIPFTVLLLLLASSCGTKVIYKDRVIYQECPTIITKPKPEFIPYDIIKLKYKDNIYYCTDLHNAKIISTNWIQYKEWCESLYISIQNYNKYIVQEKEKQKSK